MKDLNIEETETGFIVKHCIADRVRVKIYYNEQKLKHREDGPAVIHYDCRGKKAKEFHFLHGKVKDKQELPRFFKDGTRR